MITLIEITQLWDNVLIYSYPSLNGVWTPFNLDLIPNPMVDGSILAQHPTNIMYK